MTEILISYALEIVSALVVMLLGVLGSWLTTKLANNAQLATISRAQEEVIMQAQLTVGELQQTIVDALKASHDDGKLTEDEIKNLGVLLLEKTKAKLSAPAVSVLDAAKVDVSALIRSAGEAWINRIKAGSTTK